MAPSISSSIARKVVFLDRSYKGKKGCSYYHRCTYRRGTHVVAMGLLEVEGQVKVGPLYYWLLRNWHYIGTKILVNKEESAKGHGKRKGTQVLGQFNITLYYKGGGHFDLCYRSLFLSIISPTRSTAYLYTPISYNIKKHFPNVIV